jgi:uncharacterized protein YbjQ (UPF0145 family)
MILVNTDYITGKDLEILGLVKGSTIQSKTSDVISPRVLKPWSAGELKAYTEMMNEARALAHQTNGGRSEELRADAVINIRYASARSDAGRREVMVYARR